MVGDEGALRYSGWFVERAGLLVALFFLSLRFFSLHVLLVVAVFLSLLFSFLLFSSFSSAMIVARTVSISVALLASAISSLHVLVSISRLMLCYLQLAIVLILT